MTFEHQELVLISPVCPRCRYDLHGVTEAWSDRCDLQGRCSECGYTFHWADLLRGDRQRPAWCIEYSAGLLACLLALPQTALRLIVPLWFFAGLRLWHPPRLRVLLRIAAYLVVLPHCISGAVVCFGLWPYLAGLRPPVASLSRVDSLAIRLGTAASCWTRPVAELESLAVWASPAPVYFHAWKWMPPSWPGVAWPALAMWAAWPLMLLCLAPSRRLGKVAAPHVWRAVLYSAAWIILVCVIYDMETVRRVVFPGSGASLIWYLRLDPYNNSWAGELGLDLSPFAAGAGGVLAVWLAWWWYLVLVSHWRLHRGRTIWILLLCASILAAALICFGPNAYHYMWNQRRSERLSQIQPACPRCDYDLLGTMPQDLAPSARGTCPECGLEFNWSVLLDPRASAPRWFAETRLDTSAWPHFATARRTLVPWRFWRSIHMGLIASPQRAIVSSLLACVLVYAFIAIVHAVLAWSYGRTAAVPVLSGLPLLGPVFRTPLLRSIAPGSLGLWGGAWLTTVYAAALSMPLCMLLLPHTMRRARVHPRHVVRIFLYSAGPFLLIIALPGLIPGAWWCIETLLLGKGRSFGGSLFLRQWSFLLRPLTAYTALLLTWGCAFSSYVRLRHPWLHAGVLSLLAVLAGVFCTLVLHSPMVLF